MPFMTQKQIEDVMRRRRKGETLESIADRYGRTIESIRQIELKQIRKSRSELRRSRCADPLDIRVADLDAPARVKNCLRNVGADDVRRVVALSRTRLLQLNNFGRTSLLHLE